MAKVFAPSCDTTEDGCTVGVYCPSNYPYNCDANCIEIDNCNPAPIPFVLPECHPYTGDELTTADVTGAALQLGGDVTDSDGDTRYTIVDSATIANGELVTSGDDTIYWNPAAGVGTRPAGVYTGGTITIETADGNFKLYNDFTVCVTDPAQPEACVVVGGTNYGDDIIIDGNDVTICVTHSDTGSVATEWDNFVIDWGDGNSETLTIAGAPLDANNSCATHTYTAGTYFVTVSGTTLADPNNACSLPVEDCTEVICIKVSTTV